MNTLQTESCEVVSIKKTRQVWPIVESIATGTPQHVIRQSDAAKVVANLPTLEKYCSKVEKIYDNTKIDTRHLGIDLLAEETIAFCQIQGNIQPRMELYKKFAVPLAEQVAKQALANTVNCNPAKSLAEIAESICLVVFVSSTGFIAPGVDTELIKRLGLKRDTARVTVNFMGCAAAMNGLRVACDHVRANPEHRALVVCLELSSINAVFNDDMNDIIIHSIFGDGCAAVVVAACQSEQVTGQGKIVVKDHLSYLVENTEDGITLGIENNGITCKLSRQLPDYIEAGVGSVIERFLTRNALTKQDIGLWAVHPGGTRIIEKAQLSLGLTDSQVSDSWAILRQYGNMLSPAVLFVMERMFLRHMQASLMEGRANRGLRNINEHWHESSEEIQPVNGIAFSFAPGIGVEGILFQKT